MVHDLRPAFRQKRFFSPQFYDDAVETDALRDASPVHRVAIVLQHQLTLRFKRSSARRRLMLHTFLVHQFNVATPHPASRYSKHSFPTTEYTDHTESQGLGNTAFRAALREIGRTHRYRLPAACPNFQVETHSNRVSRRNDSITSSSLSSFRFQASYVRHPLSLSFTDPTVPKRMFFSILSALSSFATDPTISRSRDS